MVMVDPASSSKKNGPMVLSIQMSKQSHIGCGEIVREFIEGFHWRRTNNFVYLRSHLNKNKPHWFEPCLPQNSLNSSDVACKSVKINVLIELCMEITLNQH